MPGIAKIQTALDNNCKALIHVIHANPELAMESTFKWFEREGRGASHQTMANIQGNLATGIKAIKNHFKDSPNISFKVTDHSNVYQQRQDYDGFENINILNKEGNYEQIKQRLNQYIEDAYKSGRISSQCYRQAAGLRPIHEMVSRDDRGGQKSSEQSRGNGKNARENIDGKVSQKVVTTAYKVR